MEERRMVLQRRTLLHRPNILSEKKNFLQTRKVKRYRSFEGVCPRKPTSGSLEVSGKK